MHRQSAITSFSLIALLVVLCTGSGAGSLQAQSSIIESFTVRQLGEGFLFNWKIGKGNSCIDMQPQMSADSVTFTALGTFHGLCGTDETDSYYDWFEEGPFSPGQRYYFQIYASNGSVLSELRYIDYFAASGEELLTIAPNPLQPASGGTNIYFSNPAGGAFNLRLVDTQGKVILALNNQTSGKITLQSEGLQHGLYLVYIEQEGVLLSRQKLLVINN